MKAVREEKKQAVEDLHEKFSTAKVAVLVEFSGLSVSEITELRNDLRKARGELKVVKNTLARRAVEGTTLSEAADAFTGPIAVTFGYEDPVGPVRILKKFSDKVKGKTKLKVGMVDGAFVDGGEINRVADLPSKEVLLSSLVGSLQSPIAGLVMGLQGIIRQVVYVLSAIQEKKQ